MTFKHVKFEDSPTMRALEKVAKEKGLVKPETLQKKASVTKKADYTPSEDFMENIFKLCAGLRAAGLDKAASDLEVNYLNYKRAQTLYETSKEKGEDLVHAAHPKGSHKLENVDSSEAVVEDIIDHQLKMLEVANKSKPTGKLSSAAQIVRAVKKALGEDKAQLEAGIQAAVDDINGAVARINELTAKELTFSISGYVNHIKSLSRNPTVDNFKEIQSLLGRLQGRLNPSGTFHYMTLGTGGLSEDTWRGVQGLIGKATKAADTAINLRGKLKDLESQQEVAPPAPTAPPKADASAEMAKNIMGLSAQFSAYSNQVSSDDPKDQDALAKVREWLKQKATALQGLAGDFDREQNKEAVLGVYQGTLDKYRAALQKIQQEWA